TLRSITYGAGRFVAVGATGAAVWSDDGSNWHAASSGTSANLSFVLFADNQFIAVGSGSTLSSPDGSSWSVLTNAPSNLSCVTFAGGAFYATSLASKALYVSGVSSLRLAIRTAIPSGQMYIDTFNPVDETVWL